MATKPMSNKEKQRLRAERAAAALREKQRRERRRQILTVIGVVVAIALIVGGGFLINSMRDDAKETAAESAARQPRPHHRVGRRASPAGRLRGLPVPLTAASSRRPGTSSRRAAEQGKVQVYIARCVLPEPGRALLGALDP